MTKFYDLVHQVEWSQVSDRLLASYLSGKPEAVEKFEDVFLQLRELTPEPSGYIVSVQGLLPEEHDPEEGSLGYQETFSVCGKVGEDNYAIEYLAWEEWLGSEIHSTSLERFSPEEIINHCIWEMTWAGFTQDEIQGRADRISRVMEKSLSEINNVE